MPYVDAHVECDNCKSDMQMRPQYVLIKYPAAEVYPFRTLGAKFFCSFKCFRQWANGHDPSQAPEAAQERP